MAQYELEGLFGASFDGLKGMIDTDTVIGKPVVTADGTTIIPITRMSVGYGMGGWNYGDDKSDSTSKKDGITVNSVSSLEKICDVIPEALKVISDFIKKD